MKFRTGLILGFAAGFAVSSWVNRPEEDVYTGGDEESGGGTRARSGRARRIGQRASVMSLDAIKKARSQIQGRLRDTGDANWN